MTDLNRLTRNLANSSSLLSRESIETQNAYKVGRYAPDKTSFRPVLRALTHPSDINWVMIKNVQSRPYKRLFLLNLLAVVFLLFLTTPASLLNVVSQSTRLKSVLSLDWIDQRSAFSQFIVKNLIPTLIVLGINELLLQIINLLVDLQGKQRYSRHQRSIHRKTFVYFLFNMLLIPGVAANVINNAYDFFVVGFSDWRLFWSKLFALDNGNFFYTLLLNSAGGAFMAGLNVFYILIANYLSPVIGMLTRITERDTENWMKTNGMLIAWGSQYSTVIMVVGIGLVFQ